MVLTDREKTIATTAVVAAVGAGALYLVLNRKRIFRRFTDPLYGQKVHIVTNPEECQKVVGTLRSHCEEFRVLGLDCEWVNEQGKRRPVALLQLSSHQGLCALIRLSEMKRIPSELADLLKDPAIVKVGVGPIEDARLLKSDYNLKVESTLDLRILAEKCDIAGPYGMARLAERTLKVKMDKHWRVRASNWEAAELSERQIKYAANDAHVAVELFRRYAERIVPCSIWTNRQKWITETITELECHLDQKFREKPGGNNGGSTQSKKKLLAANKTDNLTIKRSMATRAKPLYDNCQMQAPDGELLCTCDRKKAEWYVSKDLAEIVPNQPTYTIRLKFEPKGRAVGDVGKYYQIAKENRCVVCGAKDSYIRKNVVPRDYRRHFPVVMKEHISHDVLLLCAPCHRTSNMHDENMRLMLASLCTAPYSTKENPKQIRVENLGDLRKAAKALVYNAAQIPEERKKSLQKRVQKLLPKGTEITAELLEHYANISVTIPNGDYCAHGEKVVEHFKYANGGLSELERMWREHFLKTMKPKFLPELWSIEHNFKRLEIRADEGRVDEEDLLLAGVPVPVNRRSSVDKSNSNGHSDNTESNSYEFTNSASITLPSYMDGSVNGSDNTAFDNSSYREEVFLYQERTASSSQSNAAETAFYSYREESQTLFDSATGGESSTIIANKTALEEEFQTLAPSSSSTATNGTVDKDETDMATLNDFASLETSYDSDDSDSTLSQPSMTLLNSTDDWEAEANEPSVNGTILFTKDPVAVAQQMK